MEIRLPASEFNESTFNSIKTLIGIVGENSDVIVKVEKPPIGGFHFELKSSSINPDNLRDPDNLRVPQVKFFVPDLIPDRGMQTASIRSQLGAIKQHLQLLSDNIILLEE